MLTSHFVNHSEPSLLTTRATLFSPLPSPCGETGSTPPASPCYKRPSRLCWTIEDRFHTYRVFLKPQPANLASKLHLSTRLFALPLPVIRFSFVVQDSNGPFKKIYWGLSLITSYLSTYLLISSASVYSSCSSENPSSTLRSAINL